MCTKIVDLDFNLQYMSTAGIKCLGIDDIGPFYGKPYPFDFYPESFKVQMTGNLNRAKDTREVVTQEAAAVDRNGAEIWFHSTIVPVDGNGQIEYFIIISIDTTERKQAEEALRQSEKALYEREQRLQLFIEHAPAAIAMFDRDMRYVSV